ncbi:MFS transporter [Microbacterium sp. NPDC089987]|uniref:MFS transporter n=1 Tax=Microbacterium sp. NPDC089987 TaxID=3364202 RepID=UPI00381FBBA1
MRMLLAQTTARQSRRVVLLLAAVNLVTLGSLTAPVVAVMPLKFAALLPEDQRAGALATALALGSAAALLANPLFGALSDRTRGRLGRRRPWMLGGVLAGFAFLAALATGESVTAVTASWVGAQLAFNATMAASTALLADSVTEQQRGSASGLFTAAAFVGTLPPLALSALLPRHVDAVSFVMPALAVVVVGAAMMIPERMPLQATPAEPGPRRRELLRFAGSRAFVAVWLQRFAMQAAFSLAAAFTLYLVIDRMTADTVTATPVAMVATLCGGTGIVAGAIIGGTWASRRGSYLPFFAAAGVGLAAAAMLRAVAETPVALWLAAAAGGLAVGTSLAVNLALAMRVLPARREGAYLGLLNVAETIPQVVVPVAAAALLRVGGGDPVSGAADNYAVLYATAAVIALLSLLTLPAVRRASAPEAAARPAVSTSA